MKAFVCVFRAFLCKALIQELRKKPFGRFLKILLGQFKKREHWPSAFEALSTEGRMHTLWLLAHHICAYLLSQQKVVSKGHDDSRAASHRSTAASEQERRRCRAVNVPSLWSHLPYFLDAFCGCLASMYGHRSAGLVIPVTDELFPQICVRFMHTTCWKRISFMFTSRWISSWSWVLLGSHYLGNRVPLVPGLNHIPWCTVGILPVQN